MRYLALCMVWLCPLISYGQEKANMSPKTGIEVDLKIADLKDNIPIDEEIVIFGDLPDTTVQVGSYEVWEKTCISIEKCSCPGKGDYANLDGACYRKVAGGELSIEKKKFQGRIKYFFKAKKTYRITFQYSKKLPSEFTNFIKQSLIDYYRGLFAIAGLPTAVQNARIPILKKELEQKITIKASKMAIDLKPLIIRKSLLDNDGKVILSLINPTIINKIQDFDRNMQEINTDAKRIAQLLRNFSTMSNIGMIAVLFPDDFAGNLKKVNESNAFAAAVGQGLVYLADTTQASPINITDVSEMKLKTITANITENRQIIGKMFKMNNFLSDMHLLTELNDVMERSFEHYGSIVLELPKLMQLQDELVNSNVAEEITDNFMIEKTITGDFETSARWYIGADIGVAGLNLAKNTPLNLTATNDSWRLLSYLGLNISVIPINKKNSFSQLKNYYGWGTSLLKLTSVSLGVTMSTLDKDRYKGIFNIDSPRGFLTGIGIRPIPQVKLSAGLIWYNRNNGNALTESFNIAKKTYFSASLDWDLRNILPSIKSLFN